MKPRQTIDPETGNLKNVKTKTDFFERFYISVYLLFNPKAKKVALVDYRGDEYISYVYTNSMGQLKSWVYPMAQVGELFLLRDRTINNDDSSSTYILKWYYLDPKLKIAQDLEQS